MTKTESTFMELFTRLKPGSVNQDFNGVPCIEPVSDAKKLEQSADSKSLLIEFCGIPHKELCLKYLDEGRVPFAEVLGIWHYGFRDLPNIETIIKADKKHFFAEEVFEYGMFATYVDGNNCDTGKYIHKSYEDLTYSDFREEYGLQTCFSFVEEPYRYNAIKFFLENCDEETVAQLLVRGFKNSAKVKIPDSFEPRRFMKIPAFDAIANYLPCFVEEDFQKAIEKILEMGFTQKTYHLVSEVVNSSLDAHDPCSPKSEIEYIDEEKQLEWKHNGYKFILPEKYGAVYKMNNRIFDLEGNLNLNVEVEAFGAVEVFVKKGLKYKAALEIITYDDGSLEVKQMCLPQKNPSSFTLEDFQVITEWCRKKNIVFNLGYDPWV